MKKSPLKYVRVRGIPDAFLHKTVKQAIDYYAKMLFSEQMLPHIGISVTVKYPELDDYNHPDFIEGEAWVKKVNESGHPREFIISMNDLCRPYENIMRVLLKSLAHEMVHVKQFAYRELSPDMTVWMGVKQSGDMNYWDHPWEIEAYGRAPGLYARFIDAHELRDKLQEYQCQQRI